MPGSSGRHDKTGDHHDPDDGCGGGTTIVIGSLGEQHQQRGARSPHARTDQAERDNREADTE